MKLSFSDKSPEVASPAPHLFLFGMQIWGRELVCWPPLLPLPTSPAAAFRSKDKNNLRLYHVRPHILLSVAEDSPHRCMTPPNKMVSWQRQDHQGRIRGQDRAQQRRDDCCGLQAVRFNSRRRSTHGPFGGAGMAKSPGQHFSQVSGPRRVWQWMKTYVFLKTRQLQKYQNRNKPNVNPRTKKYICR